VSSTREKNFRAKMAALESAKSLAHARAVTPTEAERFGIKLNRDGVRRTAFEMLSYPTLRFADIARIWPEFLAVSEKIAEQLEIDSKYAVYLDRQAADVVAYRRDEGFELPEDIDYARIPGLSNELRHKLKSIRPRTIGQAGRIDGITPVALTLLAAHVRRKNHRTVA
jgi:tRNA uridine 5-carboxymethylaminomethyl modification enzyme